MVQKSVKVKRMSKVMNIVDNHACQELTQMFKNQILQNDWWLSIRMIPETVSIY